MVNDSGVDWDKPQKSEILKQPESKPELEGWSWGGAILGPAFIIGIKKYSYLFVYLGYFIPFINLIVFIGMSIYLGIKGRELAYESSMFDNRSEAEGFIKAVDHAGKILFIFQVIIFSIVLVSFMTMFSSLLPMFNDMKSPYQANPYTNSRQ